MFCSVKGERVATHAPNELWTVDFKGQFRMRDWDWCYPLTLLDHHRRAAARSTRPGPSCITLAAVCHLRSYPEGFLERLATSSSAANDERQHRLATPAPSVHRRSRGAPPPGPPD